MQLPRIRVCACRGVFALCIRFGLWDGGFDMCGVDLVLKLCNLVVEVGRGKCLVEGCLPGCLENRVGMVSAGRAPDGERICLQSRAAAGACCGDKNKTWILGCATLDVYLVWQLLRNGLKRRDLALLLFCGI